MPLGKKTCPECKAVIGARTMLCTCGWSFAEKTVRKDLLKPKETELKGPKSKPGCKVCPNCQVEIGIRTRLCQCGWSFTHKRIRNDLLEEKKEKAQAQKEASVFETKERGTKQCSNCLKYVRKRVSVCPNCGTELEVEETSTTVKRDNPEVMRLLQELRGMDLPVETPRMTKRDHAEEVLKLPRDRALFLLRYSRWNHCWSHVDWVYVAEKLGEATEYKEPEKTKIGDIE